MIAGRSRKRSAWRNTNSVTGTSGIVTSGQALLKIMAASASSLRMGTCRSRDGGGKDIVRARADAGRKAQVVHRRLGDLVVEDALELVHLPLLLVQFLERAFGGRGGSRNRERAQQDGAERRDRAMTHAVSVLSQ